MRNKVSQLKMTAKEQHLHYVDGIERHFTLSSCRFEKVTKKWRCLNSPNAKRASIKITVVLHYHIEA
jgi:hypothetical protein